MALGSPFAASAAYTWLVIELTLDKAIADVFPNADAETVNWAVSGSEETEPVPTMERMLFWQQGACAL